ncbi:hypothetical protein T484DRAFT_2024712 [Baffinella frigidus]|nr:hypothetical protein T484DRAFT_2024712 [Cryptophyta sp. CCMP2293]|mmetsp:Transcript_50189/g.119370  ORF Transcript_50189/g.119370 Transcript_50189/m.119370 type:complete len:158 (-) Transcript_50189:181-654(-)
MVATAVRCEVALPANRSTLAGVGAIAGVAREATTFKDRRRGCPSKLEMALTFERLERMHIASPKVGLLNKFRPASIKAEACAMSGRSSPPMLASRSSPSTLLMRRARMSLSPSLLIVAADDASTPSPSAWQIPKAPRSGSASLESPSAQSLDRFFHG